MKNLKVLIGMLITLGTLTGAFAISSVTTTSDPMTVNAKGTLSNGLQYQATGSISSIDDISNGNLNANLLVDSSITPPTVKAQLLDGAIQVGTNSQFIIKSGTPILDNPRTKEFDVNEMDSIQPSVLITQVGKTQTDENLDVLVSLQKVTGTTAGTSILTLDGNSSDGSISIGETDLAGVKVSYQFQDSTTHQPVKLFMFPVIGDIDGNQGFSMNGTVLGHGSNLTTDASGLFSSDATLTNGFDDYPLGGLLYEFYGDTMVSQFNTTADGTANPSGVGYGIFGSYGSVKNIALIYPNATATLHLLNSFTKAPIQNAQTKTGMVYSPFTFLAPNLTGYQLNKTLTDTRKLTGTYAPNNTDVNVYYNKESSVTLNLFSNKTKQVLQKAQTISGFEGQNYKFSAPELAGYQFNTKTSDALTGAYDSNPTDLKLYYDKKSNITVNILDRQTQQPLQKAQILPGLEDEAYDITAPTLSGYRLDTKLSDATTGTYGSADKTVNLYYDKKTIVTINLVGEDSHGNNKTALETLPTLTGYAGDAFGQVLPHLQNYKFPTVPLTGTFTDDNQTLTYIYLKEMGSISVNYLNAFNNQQLLPTLNLSDNIGDKQVIRAPYIPNYTAQNSTGSDSLVTQLLPFQTINVNYVPNQENITIQYVDTAGNVVATAKNIAGHYGDAIPYEAPNFAGYDLAAGQVQNMNLHFTQPNATVSIRYAHTQGSEHFIFEDENGKQVATPQTISGNVESSYDFISPQIRYLKIVNPKQQIISGKYSTQKQTIIVRYTHLKAILQVYGVDDRGNRVYHKDFTGVEGNQKSIKLPVIKNLQLKNAKYKNFSTTLNAQNKVMIVLYNHIKTKLTVNLRIDGKVQSAFSVTGYLGDHFSMKVPLLHESYLTGGTNKISGTYTKTNQTANVDYRYVHSTITFNLYDSAGDYITSRSISGEYGQYFDYTLPAYVYDSYGYDYYPEFNTNQIGYFGVQNESYDVVYQYTGPRGTYAEQSYNPRTNQTSSQFNTASATPQGAKIKQLVIMAPDAKGSGNYVPTFVSNTSKAFVINQGGKVVYRKDYPTGTGLQGNSNNSSNSSNNNPSVPANPPAGTSPGYVYEDAARNFWIWNGTRYLQVRFTSKPNIFSIKNLKGGWHYLSASGVNEKNTLSQSNFQKFLSSILGQKVYAEDDDIYINDDAESISEEYGMDEAGVDSSLANLSKTIADIKQLDSLGEIATPNVDDKNDQVVAGIPEIASKYQVLECQEAANAIKGYLDENGVKNQIVQAESNYQYIMSNDFSWSEPISINGNHYGVEVDGMVYDNIHPFGILRSQWESDLSGRDTLKFTP